MGVGWQKKHRGLAMEKFKSGRRLVHVDSFLPCKNWIFMEVRTGWLRDLRLLDLATRNQRDT